MLDRKAILAFEDTNITTVHVTEFGGDVCVALLSAEEADQIKNLGDNDIPSNVGLVILGACDEDGKRLFTKKDAPALGKKPSRALTTIANKILEHNGLLASAVDEPKNASSETDSADSGSVSP